MDLDWYLLSGKHQRSRSHECDPAIPQTACEGRDHTLVSECLSILCPRVVGVSAHGSGVSARFDEDFLGLEGHIVD